jgi:hypothetical protein
MVYVLADNPEVDRSLHRLIALSEAGGAEFSHDLVIRCVDGNLSIEAPPESVGNVLIRLPWDCLVPLAPFDLAIADDRIVIASHEPELTGACVAMMEAMLELYALTHKLAVHRRTSPWSLAASHPEILPTLLTGRAPGYRDLIVSGNRDQLELQSFFKTRSLGYTDTEASPGYPVLMPILDAMNHHSKGAPYDLDADGTHGPTLTMARSTPLPGTGNECFACYGGHDSFDIWMGYGFLDDTPHFVRSLQIGFDLPGRGMIQTTAGFVRRKTADLPLPVRDLHFYIPALFARRHRRLDIASVLVPGPRAPRALRRTLQFLITELNPDRPPSRALVLHVEQQVIAANTTYCQTLAAFLRHMPLRDELQRPILDNFIRMCGLQLAHLRDYAGYAAG